MVGRGMAQLLFFPTVDNGETGSGPNPRTAARQSDPSEDHGKYRPQAIFASCPLVLQMWKLSPTKLKGEPVTSCLHPQAATRPLQRPSSEPMSP